MAGEEGNSAPRAAAHMPANSFLAMAWHQTGRHSSQPKNGFVATILLKCLRGARAKRRASATSHLLCDALTASGVERVEAAFDMAGVVAQLVLSGAVRAGRTPDRGGYLAATMDLVTAAYSLAKIGGPAEVGD